MPDPLFSVAGQIVIVSGGSRGIGRAIAAGFAEREATVIVTGREKATAEHTAAELREAGGDAHAIVCDVSDPTAIKRLCDEAIERFERIDTLLNVAGVNRRMRSETLTESDYDFILDINLKGAFLLSQEVGKRMLAAGRGNQINVVSLNNFAPLKWVLPYAMSKSALSQMTRGLALEWGGRGIRVNAIAPGFILTDLTKKLWSRPDMQSWGRRNTPLVRLGKPEDMVGAAIYLASEASAYMTGQTLFVDGGFSAGTAWPIEEGSPE